MSADDATLDFYPDGYEGRARSPDAKTAKFYDEAQHKQLVREAVEKFRALAAALCQTRGHVATAEMIRKLPVPGDQT